jgi:type I restriction enzyme S subunit
MPEIKELFKITKGKKEDEIDLKTDHSQRYIQIEDLRHNDNLKYCIPNSRSVYVKANDLIIAWDGANAGTVGVGLDGVIGSTLAKMELTNGKVNSYYAARFLQSKFQFLRDNCTGATIPHISRSVLENLTIPLPQLQTQKKIVEVLDKAQALIDARKEQIRLMNELIQSVFYEMFGDPDRYRKTSIDKVCKTIYDCPHSTPKYSDICTSFRCLRTSNLGKGYINWSNLAYVDEKTYYERTRRYTPQIGDVVYSREGAILGIAALVNKNTNMCLGQRLMIFTLDNKKINSTFFWMMLNSQFVRRQVELNIGGVAAPRINIKDIRNFEIFLPPIDTQNTFASIVLKIEENKLEMATFLLDMEDAYAALMQKCFKGELFGGE